MAAPDLGPVSAAAAYKTLHPRLYALAMAVQTHEGYLPGSRAWRNNNPGNLRSSPLATGNDRPEGAGMAIFPDYYAGLVALLRDLWGKATGHTTTGLSGNSTLAQLVRTWAPPVENDTVRYIDVIVKLTGFPATMPLRDLL